MKMQINAVNNGGGKGSLNVFAQLAEPSKKDGIWIKTEHVKTSQMLQLKELPRETTKRVAVAIGNEIYMPTYGGSMKYNIVTDEYTGFAQAPYVFRSQTTVVDNNIYLFGVFTNSSYPMLAYKYNILTDTYTDLKIMPYQFSDNGSVVSIGTDIYLISGQVSSYYKYLYKYDTLTDTYTRLADLPYDAYYASATAIGTDIYIFGIGNSDNKYLYKYDTLTDTYTRLADLPYIFKDGATTAIGTDIYLLGSSNSSNSQAVYKYDTLTDTYTKMIDIPYKFYEGSVVAINNNIYLLGGENSKKTVYRYNTNKEYEEISKYNYNELNVETKMPATPQNGDIYVLYGDKHATKLLEQLVLKFSDVFLYKDGETQLYPIYCGNGEEWVKILN